MALRVVDNTWPVYLPLVERRSHVTPFPTSGAQAYWTVKSVLGLWPGATRSEIQAQPISDPTAFERDLFLYKVGTGVVTVELRSDWLSSGHVPSYFRARVMLGKSLTEKFHEPHGPNRIKSTTDSNISYRAGACAE